MAVQRFSLAIGENQKMSRSEIKIVLGNFDAEGSRHVSDVNQMPRRFQARVDKQAVSLSKINQLPKFRLQLLC
jgi:hypothetical protein